MDLFNQNGAVFSNDRKYRFVLWRIWDKDKPAMLCIGLNPSNADEIRDDPTIRRLISIANTLGYGRIYMLNLFALVTPYPEELTKSDDPVGDNDIWLEEYVKKVEPSGIVVFAWGSFPEAQERAQVVMKMFSEQYCFMKNKDGSPRHPLYLPGNIKPIPYQ